MDRLQLAAIASLAWTLFGGVALLLGLLALDTHKAKAGRNQAALNTVVSPSEMDQ